MGRQLRHSYDHRDIQIAQLKAELERAYRIIDQMRWEKTRFQNQRPDIFHNGDGRLNTPLKNRVSHSPLQKNPDLRLKNRSPYLPVKKKSETADSLYLKVPSINLICCLLPS